MNTLTRRCLGVASLMLVGLSGCGEQTNEVKVSGSVTIDGKPIETGAISFVAVDGVTATGGGVIKDGTYTATVQPGEKVVLVLGNRLIGQEPEYKGMPDSPLRDKYEVITPPAYNAAHLTPLKATITDSREDLDFELTAEVNPR